MKYCNFCMMPVNENIIKCPACGKGPAAAPLPHHLLPGTVLHEKFVVGSVIGEGGFGLTYIGRDLTLDMKVAIKEYYPNGYVNRSNTETPAVNSSTSEERRAFFDKGRERFLQEARILAKFASEPGIVSVRDFFEENNTAYIVMEFLDGETLREYLKKNGTLSSEQTISMLMPIMQSLKKVHAQGLIHRDISPDNIMLFRGQVKLLDFGAARNVSGATDKSLSVMLKPGYAPEEQYRSKGSQGPWTDIYALCATMYKCITGITPDDSMQRIYRDEVKTPSLLGIHMDQTVEKAMMKGLSVHQEDRFQSIDGLLEGLQGTAALSSSEDRTMSSEDTVSFDDQETKYIENSDNDLTQHKYNTDPESSVPVTISSGIRETAPERQPDGNPPEESGKEREANEKKDTTKQAKTRWDKKTARGKKKKHRFVTIIAIAVPALLLMIVITSVFKSLGRITIGGETIDKDEKSISFYSKTLPADDIKALSSLGDLKNLYFSNCTIEDDAIQYLGSISSLLQKLTFENCTGFTDYSAISSLQYLTDLTIQNCDLTNEQLASIDFSNKEYLQKVILSENEQLSDLSPLSSLSETLTALSVDQTAVIDFSALKDCDNLYAVSAAGNSITDTATLANSSIVVLNLNDNQITDISFVKNAENLSVFSAENNKISDITALAGHELLSQVYLNNNAINNLEPLADLESLTRIEVNNNQIQSLEPISGCHKISILCANRNQLTNLNGLEEILELQILDVSDNQISDISGLTNCTILQKVFLNNNQISDISVLHKSAATLKYVYFHHNSVKNLSALEGASNLEYLGFDNNSVATLDSLADSTQLTAISAENNQITSVDGLQYSEKLQYIFLAHNQLEKIPALSDWTNGSWICVDLSSNHIDSVNVENTSSYQLLALYNNPVNMFTGIEQAMGRNLFFSYQENMVPDGLAKKFTSYKVVECPLDKQVETKDLLGSYTDFITTEEADLDVLKIKNNTNIVTYDLSRQEETEQTKGD